MAISYPLSLPDIPTPQQIVLSEIDFAGLLASPFTGAQEIQDWGNQQWMAKLSWSRISARAKAAPLRAVLTALRGPIGTILLGDPLGKMPRGALGGVPIVDGAHAARGQQLSIRAAAFSVAAWLKADDYIQLGSGAQTRLHKVLQDVDTDISGNAVIDIWPALREDYADAAPVTLTNCVGTFRCAVARRDWTVTPSSYAHELDFIEAL